MKLIVGLGNPGKQYENTRHNAGFMVIDQLCEKLNCQLTQKKFNAHFEKINVNGQSIILCKPQTYMNNSGEAVLQLVNYFKIKIEDIIIIYDDIALPIGKIRLRKNGSSGGQKGMQSIINLLHTNNIFRIRVGIKEETNLSIVNFVLSKFSKENLPLLKESIQNACNAALVPSFDQAMNQFN